MRFYLVKLIFAAIFCFAQTAKSENTFQLKQERSLNYEKEFKSAACAARTTYGECCVFPFIYRGVRYFKCTTVDYGNTPWCSTTSNYDNDKKWGICSRT